MRRAQLLAVLAIVAASMSAWSLGSSGPVSAAAGYAPLPAPQRLLDTRPGETTADGQFAGVGPVRSNSQLALAVAGRAGLPAEPGSIVLNVTATGSNGNGYVTAWPCDESRPTTANLNFRSSQTIANTVISRVAANGTVCFYAKTTVHLVVDAGGVLPTGSFHPLEAPERLADTRGTGTTVDGAFVGAGRSAAGSTFRVAIAGRGTVPGDATAAVLNITATGTTDRGYLTIHPCDTARPVAANLTYSAGQTIPNAVITRLDVDGDICIYTRAATDLVVDVTGVLPESVFHPLDAPQRLLDTRPGESTADGQFLGAGRQPSGGTLQLDVAGRVGIPANATTVVLNVTSTGSVGNGYITAHPQGTQRPTAANLNHPAGVNVSNLVVAALGSQGDTCLYTKTSTHLVVDVVGWMEGSAATTATTACPANEVITDVEALRNQLVRRPALQRAVGADRIAVFICTVPANSTGWSGAGRHTVTAAQAAAFLQAEVAPYYAEESGGRYSVQFVGAGSFAMAAGDGPSQCVQGAEQRAGAPYTGALGIDSTHSGGGFAGPGLISSLPQFDRTVFDGPPTSSRRGGWLGGGNVSIRPNPAAFVHELGHMLHWPHSFIGPSEYDNWVDVMSRGQGWCDSGGGSQYNCDPAHTLAFNRFAAGWLQNGQVVVHRADTASYRVDRPGTAGLQMVLLPDATQPFSALTLEARPAVGHDDFLEREGIAVHVVDQVKRTDDFLAGISTERRQRQARGAPLGYDHVIAVGETATVHGVTITVVRRIGQGYDITVTGSYQMPGDAFFTELDARVGPVSCASMAIDDALAAGCVL